MKENLLLLRDLYAEYNEDFNKKDPKFKFDDHVRISNYKVTYFALLYINI